MILNHATLLTRFFWQALLLLLVSFPSHTAPSPSPAPEDQVFAFHATLENKQQIQLVWQIAPGYYLYRNHIHFSLIHSQHKQSIQPIWPTSNQVKNYPSMGNLPVYNGTLTISLKFALPVRKPFTLHVSYQGCSDQGFCYPPIQKNIRLNNNQLNITTTPHQTTAPFQPNQATQLLAHKNIFFILLGFLGFGLLLAFSPCVLPMIPILSTLLVSQAKENQKRAFALSLSYVLGMALTYAIAGVAAGFIGSMIQSSLQKPWVLILFTILFILMALSLFGYYDIQLPEKWQNWLHQKNTRQKKSNYISTAIIGSLATLILSPCITPALVGALTYISQTSDAVLGGLALFIMGLGMGIPLLIIGIFSSKLLPKAGPWLHIIKKILGILLLGLAIWTLARILPSVITMILWGILLIGCAFALGAFSTQTTIAQKIFKSIGMVFFIYGIILIFNGLSGYTNPLKPLAPITQKTTARQTVFTTTITNLAQLKEALKRAQTEQKPVLIDFYADWCIACQVIEATLKKPRAQSALTHFYMIRADITKNDTDAKALMHHYDIIAPPTLLFFNRQGTEIKQARIFGTISVNKLLKHINQHLLHVSTRQLNKKENFFKKASNGMKHAIICFDLDKIRSL